MSANKTISELQGQFLQLLMRITRPRSVLELGCFMGYSAMAMADGMSRGTTLYTCEKDAKAARLARDLFVERGYLHPHHPRDASGGNGVQHGVRIQLLEGDAMSSLESLTQQRLQFDAVFLDADKGNYINYLNRILDGDLLSENGYIIADNVLFRGMVLPQRSDSEGDEAELPSPAPSPPLSPQQDDPKADTERVRSRTSLQRTADHMDAFNRHVKGDPRLEVVVLPIFDGISVIVRKNKA
ncbi:hypothetical protein BGZ98_007018 [Dissophora globulifera]|nr:hypothetical protein BGZ98_007018 [Dissophora globulifera]